MLEEVQVQAAQAPRWIDWLTLAAIVIGPIAALRIEKWIEDYREKRDRRLGMYRTLMSTRLSKLSDRHVTTLSLIDVEYLAKQPKDKPILDAWKAYHLHLCDVPPLPTGAPESQEHTVMVARAVEWDTRCNELLYALLDAMGRPLGYEFTRDEIARGPYKPIAHDKDQAMNNAVKEWVFQMSQGQALVPITAVSTPEEQADNARIRAALLELLNRSNIEVKSPEPKT